jgi:hypothetical protein
MRILAALVLGYYMVMGRVGAEVGDKGGSIRRVPVGMTTPARSEIDNALGISLSDAMTRSDATDAPVRHVTRQGRVVFIPEGCRSVQQSYDLVVHFHGAPTSLEPTYERSGIGGVLAIFNLGNGSGKYEEAFAQPGSFEDALSRTAEVVAELCPGASRVQRRIALSAWSAGYGSIWKVLDRQALADRVDAVLLADGLHGGFEPDHKAQRVVNADQMAAFSLYADRAAAGEKLLAITHSSIMTPYASTTETASFLLMQQNIPRVTQNLPGPRPGMLMLSRADRGSLHVQGYAGNDAPAHCDHLHAMGDTLFPYLRDLWSRKSQATPALARQ